MSGTDKPRKQVHVIHAERLAFMGTNKNADKITISSFRNTALDFENIDHIEIDDARVKQLTNEYTDADMITFSATNRIDFHSRTLDNVSITNGTMNGGNITGATLTNCNVDLPSGFESVLLETDANGTLTAGDATSKKVITDNTATLSNKTIDGSCTLDPSLTVGGYTANKVLQSDASGDIDATSFAPNEVILTTGVQTFEDKTMNDCSLSNPIFTNALRVPDATPAGTPMLTLGATSAFEGDLQVKGNDIKESNGYTRITFDPSTPLTTITGKLEVEQDLTTDDIRSRDDPTNVAIDMSVDTPGFPQGIKANTISEYSGSSTTLSADTIAITNDLRLNGRVIQNELGANWITTTGSSNTIIYGELAVASVIDRYNGGLLTDWLSTDGTTTTVSDNIVSTGDITAGDGTSAEYLKVNNTYGTIIVGPQNASYCHFDTDRATFYFGKQIQVNGYLNPYSNGNDLGSSSYRWSLYADTIDASSNTTIGGTLEAQSTCYLAGTSSGTHIRVFQDGSSQNSINCYDAGSAIEDLGIQSHGGDTYFGLYTSSRLRVMSWGIQRYGANGAVSTLWLNYYGGETILGANATPSNLRVYGEVRSEYESGSGNDIYMTARDGSLPGYPNDSYPTLKTDYSNMYFSVGGNYSGYLATASVGQIDFTGQHRCIPEEDNLFDESLIGRIVYSTGKINSLIPDEDGVHQPTTGKDGIDVVEAIPVVALCDENQDKRCFGVIASIKDDDKDGLKEFKQGVFTSMVQAPIEDNRLTINSLGEGGIWVVNVNGNIKNGDYITTCDVAEGGYGAKQADDLLHNYTCAKATITCNFVLDGANYKCEEFEDGGKTYRKAFISCVYKF